MSLPRLMDDQIEQLAKKLTQYILTNDSPRLQEALEAILGFSTGKLEAVAMDSAILTASPLVVVNADILATDLVIVQLTLDDTGGPLGIVTGLAGDGDLTLTSASAPTNGDGAVTYLVMRRL